MVEITEKKRRAMELAAKVSLRKPILEFVVAMDTVGKGMIDEGLPEEEANALLNSIYTDFAEQIHSQVENDTIVVAIKV